MAWARAKWLVSGGGVDLADNTHPRPAKWLASHFVGLASHSAESGLRVLHIIWAPGGLFFVTDILY
jgi:hypothetical protein